jgi:hypothetical protein
MGSVVVTDVFFEVGTEFLIIIKIKSVFQRFNLCIS